MRLPVRFSTLPVPLLEGIIKKNEEEIKELDKEHEKRKRERQTFNSFYELLSELYQGVCHADTPSTAIIIGTAVGDTTVYVRGIPQELSPDEVVLNPYWNKVTLLGKKKDDERDMSVAGATNNVYVERLPLASKSAIKEGWVSGPLIIPLNQIYTYSRLELPEPVSRQVYARCGLWEEVAQKTA